MKYVILNIYIYISRQSWEYKKIYISYFYFSQTLKPKTQRDRNTFPRAQDGTRVKKLVRPHIRATGFTCAAEDTGATPSRSVSHNNAKPSSMPANKHCTHKHRRALWQGEERVSSFQGWAPLHTRNHLTRRLKMSWITQRSRKQVSALRVGARGRDVKQTNIPRWEGKKKGICHSQRQEKRCIVDKRPDWQYAQTQAAQGCCFFTF